MTTHPLEEHMGDPRDPDGPLSFARAVALDEAEAYPEEAAAHLEAWGLHRHYVPVRHGGALRSFDDFVTLVRLVSRRNLTVSVCHTKTFYGACPLWVGGDDAQQRRAAERLLAGEQAALAFHEQEHGSDFLAVDTRALREGRGYVLEGTKWLVNNATRSSALSLFARTDPRGGPRGFSILWVEKDALTPPRFATLPRLRPLGIRGADFSGIRFDGCVAPESAVVGAPGSGLELSVRTFQVTRALMPAISLGAGDTGLRLALDFAVGRSLYGQSVAELPYPRRILGDAFVDLLVSEALVRAAARSLHVAPEAGRLWSSIAKYQVPVTVDALLYEVAAVLGGRHYLREGHGAGMFQKMLRDHAVVRVFHAGAFLLLQTVGQYLRWLAARRGRGAIADDPARPEALFRWTNELPDFDAARIGTGFRDGGDPGRSLRRSLEELGGSGLPAARREVLTRLAGELAEVAGEDRARLAREAEELGRDFGSSPELFELARRHCLLESGSVALATWLANRETLQDGLEDGAWVAVALARCLRGLGRTGARAPASCHDEVWSTLAALHRGGRLFSATPLTLAGA